MSILRTNSKKKYLGVLIDEGFYFREYIYYIIHKITWNAGILR